ncbi:Carbonic anhydrase 2 [Streptomyces lavendulae subsp. lavendulae]|uniref:Carbonic anhydrase 2 n=1 Tax=Streptomyces lavendulae subsp. lavendulae TaxID=58340 RepID=A0A2K8P7G5_STRLA|nr:Carbonic anhydrase 2 [Streptomyces lavendulae subsp. lavendulae]QUQ52521.1 hypothetical protein SLLC_01890 [Streptomyces lavendulae subsp. lavendulae]
MRASRLGTSNTLQPKGGSTSRRTLLRTAAAGTAAAGSVLALGSAFPATAAPAGPPAGARPATPEQALRELAAGNRRWRTYRQEHPNESPSTRLRLAKGQQPFAIVLGCVDSRVPPELVFDQGLGDLLTVRSAGEVLDEAVLGSIAYGVLELSIPLVLVLGHQSCGAVGAAVHADETGDRLPTSSTWPTRYARRSTGAGRARPASAPPSTPMPAAPATGSPPNPTWPAPYPQGSWPWPPPATN